MVDWTWLTAVVLGAAPLAIFLAVELAYRRQRREHEAASADIALQYVRIEQMLRSFKAPNEFGHASIASRDHPIATHDPPNSPAQSESIQGDLVSEINHSLNTPLLQIELSLMRFERAHMEDSETIRAALSSVDLCRSVLTAYRDLSAIISTTADLWDLEDFSAAGRLALETFLSAHGRSDLRISVSAPPKPHSGLSNYFLLSAVLPLLENSIECAATDSVVRFEVREDVSELRVVVSNMIEHGVDTRRIGVDGFTSKRNGHAGTGVASVKTLLSRIAGAQLTLESSADRFRATILIPSYASNDLSS